MLNWICHHVCSSHIVTIETSRSSDCDAQIKENLAEPNSLSNIIANNMMLNFSGGLENSELFLGALDNEVGSKVNCVTCGRATGVFTISSVHI